jgi:hypothetical protein
MELLRAVFVVYPVRFDSMKSGWTLLGGGL